MYQEQKFLSVRNFDFLTPTEEYDDNMEMYTWKCQYCGMSLGTISGKTRHENNCSHNPSISKEKRSWMFSCNKCGHNFSRKHYLSSHIAYDCGRTHKCEICHKIYSQIAHLKRHFRKVHTDSS